jgi:hypothetical protein
MSVLKRKSHSSSNSSQGSAPESSHATPFSSSQHKRRRLWFAPTSSEQEQKSESTTSTSAWSDVELHRLFSAVNQYGWRAYYPIAQAVRTKNVVQVASYLAVLNHAATSSSVSTVTHPEAIHVEEQDIESPIESADDTDSSDHTDSVESDIKRTQSSSAADSIPPDPSPFSTTGSQTSSSLLDSVAVHNLIGQVSVKARISKHSSLMRARNPQKYISDSALHGVHRKLHCFIRSITHLACILATERTEAMQQRSIAKTGYSYFVGPNPTHITVCPIDTRQASALIWHSLRQSPRH